MSNAISADRLKSFIERIERLIDERASIQSDIKDIFSEAKGVGYDVKTMRRLIQIRAQDSADRAEQEALLDTYMHALGMNAGASGAVREPTEEELEERAGRIVAEVDRLMALVVDGQLPSIAAIREEIGCSLGKASKLRGLVEQRISRSMPEMREMKSSGGVDGHAVEKPTSEAAAPVALPKCSTPAGVEPGPLDPSATVIGMVIGNVELVFENPGREMTEDDLGDPLLVIDKPRAQFREKVRVIASSVKQPEKAALAAFSEDDLAIPPALDRRKVA